MGTEAFDAVRLAGWKEIGNYLGVDARTAQRWERERGLPVARADGEKGRVTADPAELDRWRAATSKGPSPSNTPTLEVRSSRPWTNIKTLQLYSMSTTALVLILASVVGVIYVRTSVIGPPSTVRLDGNALLVVDRKGKPVWRYVFDESVSAYAYTADTIAQNIVFADLTGHGRRDLLFLYWHRNQLDGPFQTDLLAFSEKGRLLWRYTPRAQIADANQRYTPEYVIDQFVWVPGRDGRKPVVIATSHHSVSYPCQVVALDPSGTVVGRYWHSGHLYHMGVVDIDGDGREEVLLGGANIGYHQATLVALDPWRLAGTSTQPAGDWHQLQVEQRGTERAVLLFPRTELNERTEATNFVMALWHEPGSVQVSVREKRLGESGYVSYTLDEHLRVRSVIPSEGLIKLYEQNRATKQLSRDLVHDELPRLWQLTYLFPNQRAAQARKYGL